MASLNKVFLIGNLTRDPELRYTPSGTAVAELNIAVNQRSVNKNTGEQKDDVVFVNVTVWSKQAEACGQYLAKGSSLFIEGRLQFDSWEGKDGQKRNRLRVIAQRVQFIGKPKGARAEQSPRVNSENISQEIPETNFEQMEDVGIEEMPPSEQSGNVPF
jgi:single-strand DNA-binding protein